VYTKYENNPFKIVVCSLRKPNSFWRLRRHTRPKPKYPRLRPNSGWGIFKFLYFMSKTLKIYCIF
jgi:hypothetical protein